MFRRAKKKKISDTLSKRIVDLHIGQKSKIFYTNCKECGKLIASRKGNSFCSKSCSCRNMSIIGWKKAQKRTTKRSKNEIYFADLCKSYFINVLTNERMFNGWDADIIIEDTKIAILWNGPWHYRKITQKHSLLQVQNRDKIKIKEIEKCGYIPYIIKDDKGRYNKNFVENQFKIFIAGSPGGNLGS